MALSIGNTSNSAKRKRISAGYVGKTWIARHLGSSLSGQYVTAAATKDFSNMYAADNYTANIGNPSYLYRCTDFGSTWQPITSAGSAVTFYGVACSSEGSIIYLTKFDSTNGTRMIKSTDYGTTWGTVLGTALSKVPTEVSCSANGSVVYTNANGTINYSRDGGSNWTAVTSTLGSVTTSIADGAFPKCSANGSVVIAKLSTNYIGYSTNGGAAWSTATTVGVGGTSLGTGDLRFAISGNGSVMYVTKYNNYIYKSSDSGATWGTVTSAGTNTWLGISCSYDGSKVFVGFNSNVASNTIGTVSYTSTDGGTTWIPRNNILFASSRRHYYGYWNDGVCADDGAYAVFVNYMTINGGVTTTSYI
jgi:hypothetical protein